MSDNPNVHPVSPGYYPYPPPPPPRRSGCLVAVAVLLGLGLGVSMLLNLGLLARAGGAVPGVMHEPEPLAERLVTGSGDAKVALIELEGVIMEEVSSGGLFGIVSKPVDRIRRELESAAKDPKVKAVIFAVNSPGGTITASDEIHHLIARFRETSKKKVVVHMGGLAASGGYYVSAGADRIWAGPTTITGSIGVILQTFNFSDTLNVFKVQNLTIQAGANKDLLNPWKPINEEHVKNIQNMVDKAYDRFVEVIETGRKLPRERVRALADGRIYPAAEAKELGLIDEVGYLEDVIEDVKKITGSAEVTVFRYTRQPSIFETLAGAEAAAAVPVPRGGGAALDVAATLLATPRICYLWAPAVPTLATGR